MKLTISDLENASKELPPVSSGNPIPNVLPEKPYGKEDVNFRAASDIDVYPASELMKVAEMGWGLERFLNAALKKRDSGIRALSFREADIAARGKIDLTRDSTLEYALMEMLCTINEGVPGAEESGYELRRRYNHGLKWMGKHEKTGFLPGMREKAIERLAEIRRLLVSAGLDLWPHEVDTGFHADLLRPEWMTHTQYNRCRKYPVKIVEVTDVNVQG